MTYTGGTLKPRPVFFKVAGRRGEILRRPSS